MRNAEKGRPVKGASFFLHAAVISPVLTLSDIPDRSSEKGNRALTLKAEAAMLFRKAVSVAGVIAAFALPASAQEEATPEPSQPPANSQDQYPVDPVNPVEQMEIEQFGDWAKRCVTGTEECVINQLARDTNGNPVAEINILQLAEGGDARAGVTVITPLGTLLTSGIRIQVDGGRALQYPFGWCEQRGCISRFGLTQDSVNSLKNGAVATLTLFAVANPKKPVSLDISLTGFTAAYDALKKKP
ncbi:MAG: invasion associated locus B family protein [Paracoccaceae bacterium]